MHISSLYYNSNGVEETNNDDVSPRRGFVLWVDITDPKSHELDFIQDRYNIDKDTLKVIKHQAKRPQACILDNYTFTIILHMHYKTLKELLISGIYIYSGKDWLITIHSSEVDLVNPIKFIFKQKYKKLLESVVDALYFTILGEMISKYEQLLTSIELTITEFEQMALYKKVSVYAELSKPKQNR